MADVALKLDEYKYFGTKVKPITFIFLPNKLKAELDSTLSDM